MRSLRGAGKIRIRPYAFLETFIYKINSLEAMELKLKRIARKPTYTIGKMYINGEYFCDTIEDVDRGLKQTDDLNKISSVKVKGQTAIPVGRYLVTKTFSTRFKRNMYLLNNVPGFAGIRIHAGNTDKDTEGCLILGKNKAVGKVLESRDTVNAFEKVLDKVTNEKIYMTVE